MLWPGLLTTGMKWAIPLSAGRGPVLFRGQVGMATGPKFAATVTATESRMLGRDALVMVALVVSILIPRLFIFLRPCHPRMHQEAGAPDRPDTTISMIFPGMSVVKILFGNLVPGIFRSG